MVTTPTDTARLDVCDLTDILLQTTEGRCLPRGCELSDRQVRTLVTVALLDADDDDFRPEWRRWVDAPPHRGVSVTRPSEGTTVLAAFGSVGLDGAEALRTSIRRELDRRPTTLVVDLGPATRLDSSGLGVLLAGHRWAADVGTTFLVVVPHPRLRRVFELTNTSRVLRICTSLQDALP